MKASLALIIVVAALMLVPTGTVLGSTPSHATTLGNLALTSTPRSSEARFSSALSPPPNAPAPSVADTITVGSFPEGVAYDSGKEEVFIANARSNNVSVVSNANNIVVATVAVGQTPQSVAYDSGTGEVFVANAGSDNVSVISDATDRVVATVAVGSTPNGMAYDSGTGEVFVANTESGNVSILSDTNNAVVATVAVGPLPYGVAYDGGKGEVFVATYSFYGSSFPPEIPGVVSVLSDANNTVVAMITVGLYPYGVAYDSGTGEVFVANSGSDNVSVISDTTNAVVAAIPAGWYPNGVAYDTGNGRIYVSNALQGTISTISTGPTPVAGFLGLSGNIGYYVLAGVAGAVVVGVSAVLIVKSQRRP